MDDQNNDGDQSKNENQEQTNEPSKKLQLVTDKYKTKNEIKDEIKEGDESLNKLKVQHLDFVLDIPVKVTVELGRTRILIKDILQLGQGSVMELNKLAGDFLEILANGKMIAKGEVVVVNEKFGIRITEIITPIDRIETLK
jgi:flagellar motor switch protein FliN/FliY